MINANNLIINITQHNRSKSNGKSHENFKKMGVDSPTKGARFNFNSETQNADEIIRQIKTAGQNNRSKKLQNNFYGSSTNQTPFSQTPNQFQQFQNYKAKMYHQNT